VNGDGAAEMARALDAHPHHLVSVKQANELDETLLGVGHLPCRDEPTGLVDDRDLQGCLCACQCRRTLLPLTLLLPTGDGEALDDGCLPVAVTVGENARWRLGTWLFDSDVVCPRMLARRRPRGHIKERPSW
jgi:hypothetical protein